MSGSSGGCVGEGGLEEDPDIPMHRKLETMKMNKIHFNLDTMVQNITLLQNTRLDNLSFPLCFMATSDNWKRN